METFTYYMTIEVQAMNEESSENKLEGFLKSLDLKKNQHLTLTSLEVGDDEIDMSDGDEPVPQEAESKGEPKKERPPIRLPKGKGSAKWEDDFDDADWDDLDEEKTENPKVKAEDLESEAPESSEDEDEDDWEWEDDWDDEDDEDEEDDIDGLLKGL